MICNGKPLIFCLPVGLEPQVRVWPSRPALPVADAAGRLVVLRSARRKPALSGAADAGNRKPETGTKNNGRLSPPIIFQSVKELVFDRLTEVKEAVKTNNSHSSAYGWYGRVGVMQ